MVGCSWSQPDALTRGFFELEEIICFHYTGLPVGVSVLGKACREQRVPCFSLRHLLVCLILESRYLVFALLCCSEALFWAIGYEKGYYGLYELSEDC